MSALRLLVLRSAAEFKERAEDWNDLWRRSQAVLPTNRAEGVSVWMDAFGENRALEAWVVECDGRFVAGVPLVRAGRARVLQMKRQVSNFWSPQGDLLVDENEPIDEAIDCLVAGLKESTQSLYWFHAVPIESLRWRTFLSAVNRAGLMSEQRPVAEVGRVDIQQDWAHYMASWSRNHRRHIRRAQTKADVAGGVELRLIRPTADEVEPLLREGFKIEDGGWKGREGTSVLKTPGMFEFFVRQATTLAERGEMLLTFLDHCGRSIAFEYAPTAKGTYVPLKVAYDEEFSDWAPGQLLRSHLFERFFNDPAMKGVDFSGPLVDATEKWITGAYRVARLVVASGGMRSRAFMAAYQNGMPAVRHARSVYQRLRGGR